MRNIRRTTISVFLYYLIAIIVTNEDNNGCNCYISKENVEKDYIHENIFHIIETDIEIYDENMIEICDENSVRKAIIVEVVSISVKELKR